MANNRLYLRHKSTTKCVGLAHQFGGDWEISIESLDDTLAKFFSELGYVPADHFYLEVEHPYDPTYPMKHMKRNES